MNAFANCNRFLNLRQQLAGRLALLTVALVAAGNACAADLVWINTGGGDWNVAANWSPVQVPSAADSAWITNIGTYTVTVPAGTTATAGSVLLGGASGTQTMVIDRATLTLAGASVVNPNGQLDLTVSQSVLNGAGNLTVNGTLNWVNGTLSGTGTASIGGAGVLAIGSAGVTLARTLNNSGLTTWGGGNLTMSAGAVLNNQGSGTFDIAAGGHLNGSAATPIDNSGLFRQTGGTGITIITAPVSNSGTLQVLNATLSLNLGGNYAGTISTAPGATLQFGGGSHLLASGSLVTGAGIVAVAGNNTSLTASGAFDVGSTFSITAGIATLSTSCNVTGATLNIAGGTLNFDSAGSVGVVNVTGGTLGGVSPVAVTGPLTLGGGTVTNALVNADGGLTINGNTTLSGGKLINPGTAIWSAGSFTGANGAVFSNLFGATFINTFDGNAGSGAGGTPVFVNSGLFQKTGGTAALGTTSIDYQFINTGIVEVQTNTLRYAVNEQTAGLTLLDGGDLRAQAQPLQLLGGSLIGTGLVTVANNQNFINSGTLDPGLPLGQLDIAGNFQQTASGVLNIQLGGQLPGVDFDLVTVSLTASLAGTLNVTLTNGFSPAKGATFTFLTALSRVGAFATFNYPSNEIGLQLSSDAISATLKVTNLKPVVANPIVDPAAVTYGESFNVQFPSPTFTDPDNDLLSYTASGMPPGINFTAATRTFSGTPTEAGDFPVQVVANDGGSPNLTATNTFNITINTAALSVTADSRTKTYGGSDPGFTASYAGFVNNETAAVLGGTLAFSRAPGENAGDYLITPSGLTSANYTITFNTGTLSITKAGLSVTADSKTKTYGASDPTFTASYAGFVNNETAAVLGGTLAFSRAPGENAGDYLITPSGLTSANYTITFNTGILSVTKAALSVAADSKTKSYGASDPTFTASYAGFVNNETAAVLGGTLAFSRAPGESVGNYLITPSGLTSANYTITFNTGNLSVTKAALSVTADSKTKAYGASDPTFTASYAGFVNNETVAVLGGTLVFSRAPGESVGDYLITPSGLTSANYTITFNTGILTINPSAPVLLSPTVTSTGNVVITWSAASNVTYRVQFKSDLNAVDWSDLPGDVTSAGSVASKIDPTITGSRFYRIQVLP